LRQVKEAEGNFKHMYSIQEIIPCIKNLSNTETIILAYETIQSMDEPAVTPCRAPFIKKYHHFTYPRPGVVHCKYMKGTGQYQEELMKQVQEKGIFTHSAVWGFFFLFFLFFLDDWMAD
jgi:hypothetical protein